MIHHWERGAGYLGDEKYTDTQHAMLIQNTQKTQEHTENTKKHKSTQKTQEHKKYTDTQHAMYLYRVTDTQVYRQYTDTQHAMLTHKNKPIPTYMRKKCKYKTSNAQTKEKNTEKTVHRTTTQAMITYRKQICVKV